MTVLIVGLAGAGTLVAQVNVTTQKNDIARTGQNLNETILTLSNVNTNSFGKLFSQPVDGQIYTQPLYMSGVTIAGVKHNVVFVGTENDSMYAFDADTNGGINASPLWKDSMLDPAHGAAAGATAVSTASGADINPIYGITGTPVIDPASGTLYVVSATAEGSAYPMRLHALDITSGAEKFGGPINITGTAAGTGNGSVNSVLTFDPEWQNQRAGLLLLNGIVWIAFGSHMDNGPWHGWIMGYNATTLKQTGVYCTSPNGLGSGVWMAGTGLAADVLDPINHPYGRMFVATGNGDYNATKPYANSMDYGDSHLAFDLSNGVPTLTDEFTTKNQASLDAQDEDLASGGIVLLPTQSGSVPNLLVQTGKEGNLYLINRDNMGGYSTTTNNIVEEIDGAVGTPGIWGSPAYWNGNLYYWGNGDYLKSFALSNGMLSTTPTKNSVYTNFPGSTPSISANGNTNALLWTVDTSAYNTGGVAILRAFDATNITSQPYSTQGNPSRDTPGPAVKFAVPTVVNGKVYLGTGELDVYGLLNGQTQAATPVLSPGTESFNNQVTVTITDATAGATIYYTTDGTKPTPASAVYSQPLVLTTSQTINAIASATGSLVSGVGTATYTNLNQVSPVVFSEAGGTYTSAQSITLTDATANSTIYYTINGSTPTTSSAVYKSPISVASTKTITAIATASSFTNSNPVANTYTIISPTSGFSYPDGFADSTSTVIFNGSTGLDDSRLQLTNGINNEAGSAWYYQPMNIQQFTIDFTFQLSNPAGDGITFAIQNSPGGSAALGNDGSSLGYAPIANSIAIKFDFHNNAGEGNDSTGLYLNGAVPTVPAIDLTSTPINLLSGDTFAAHLLYDGTTLTMTINDTVTGGYWYTTWTVNIPSTVGSNTAYLGFTGGTGGASSSQKITSWSYVNSQDKPQVAAPQASPAAGTYYGTQTISLSDTTTGANIYYTTDGSTPTSSSTAYSTPISVTASETIRAIALAPAGSNSAVVNSAYVIKPITATATPGFSTPTGVRNTPFSLTLTDGTSQSVIYYTTNGATPTTSSTQYTAPFTVQGTQTVKAIALAVNHSLSSVGSATYTFNAQPPTFSPAAGKYTSVQSVALATTTPGATIYYTTNGSTPSTSSTVYAQPVPVGATETIKAIAVEAGYTTSSVSSAAYTITLPTATPAFSPAAGTYSGTQTVTLSDSTSGAKIYYTTNGSTPTTSSTLYSGPISVSASETLNAIAVSNGLANSAVGTAAYTIQTLPATTAPVFNVTSGVRSTPFSLTIGDSTSKAVIYYTTNGTAPTTSSSVYSAPLSISSTQTVQAIALAPSHSTSTTTSASYTFVAQPPTFSPAAGKYTSVQSLRLATTTAGASIYYTTDGTTPTSASTLYSQPISVSKTQTIKAIAIETGFTNSSVSTAAYTITLP